MKVSKWVIWVVFFVAIFVIGYIATSVFVKAVMKDFHVKNTGYTEIEVKPVPENSFQTDQAKLYQVKNVQEQ